MTRALLPLILAARKKNESKVTLEPIMNILGDGKYMVGGAVNGPLSPIGRATFRPGELANVLWKREPPGTAKPVGLLKHKVKKAKFHATHVTGGGIVEELFLAQAGSSSAYDVYFRNGVVCGPLGVAKLLPGKSFLVGNSTTPAVQWGTGRNAFAVRSGNDWYVFNVVRDPTHGVSVIPNISLRQQVSLVGVQKSFTVTFKFTRNSTAKIGTCSIVSDNEFETSGSFTSPGWTSVPITAAATRRVTLLMNGADFSATCDAPSMLSSECQSEVTSWLLDEQFNILVTLALKVSVTVSADANHVASGTSSALRSDDAFGAGGGVYDTGPWPSVYARNDLTGLSSSPPSPMSIGSVSETHLMIVNATKKAILFTTLLGDQTLNSEQSVNATLLGAIATSSLGSGAVHNYAGGGGGAVGIAPSSYVSVNGYQNANQDPITVRMINDFGFFGYLGMVKRETDLFDRGVLPLPPKETRMIQSVNPPLEPLATYVPAPDAVAPYNTTTRGYDFLFAYNSDTFTLKIDDVYPFQYTVYAVHVGKFALSAMVSRFQLNVGAHITYAQKGLPTGLLWAVHAALRPNVHAWPINWPLAGDNDPSTLNRTHIVASRDDVSSTQIFSMVNGQIQLMTTLQGVAQDPVVLAGSGRHVLFKVGELVYLADFVTNAVKQVGTNATVLINADDPPPLVLTNPDFLYASQDARRCFIVGWDRKTRMIKLNTDASLIPQIDATLTAVRELIEIPKGVTLPSTSTALYKSFQTINDQDALASVGRGGEHDGIP
jgi:hypothetical protein